MKICSFLFLVLFPVFSYSQTSVAGDAHSTFTFDTISPKTDGNKEFQENYTKGIAFYNKGVDLINHMKPDGNPAELDKVQGEAKAQFKLALPFLEKAYGLNKTNRTLLKALQGTYFSQYDFEKSDKMKKELESLKK